MLSPDPADPNKKVRIIRMRMTLRGFKDKEAEGLVTYAGTSSRPSQRLIVSEAVIRGWPLATIDVRKAFLKGLTYKELAEADGAPQREVNFELGADAVAVLRQCPGYSDFNPATEVLHMEKPGTGCKEAPRCFGLKLKRADDKFGAKPLTHDNQCIVRHGGPQNELDFVATKHVDDVKAACSPATLQAFIAVLESVFGKGELDITLENFTNCGVRHIRLTDSDKQVGYSMDQEEYIDALKTIDDPSLVGLKTDSPVNSTVMSLFLSLLMALAYTLLTRPDLCVYVTALQRVAQKPLCQHVRKLNVLVRWAKKHPIRIVYRVMVCQSRLLGESDAGFRKETDEDGHLNGRSSRGSNYLRVGQRLTDESTQVHLLDWSQGAIKQVTRSTFTAESHGAIATMDHGMVLKTMLHEMQYGPVTLEVAKELTEGPSQHIYFDTGTDAYNLVLSLSRDRVKPPAEQSFLCHLLWMHQKLEQGAVTRLLWTDTRDITADPHTKGAASRKPIHEVCSGVYFQRHANAELVLHGPDKGLHHLAKCGRRMTPGEIAQCGRGVACSANEDGDGPASGLYAEPTWLTYNPWAALEFTGTRREGCLLTIQDIMSRYRVASRRAHPDKGGCHLKFVALANAKDYLVGLLQTDNRLEFEASACQHLKAEAPDDDDDDDSEFVDLTDEPPPTSELPTEKRVDADHADFEAPGVHLLQRTLDSAWRSRTKSAMSTKESRETAMQAREDLSLRRAVSVKVSSADRVNYATKTAAKKRMAAQVASSRMRRALKRQLDASALDMRKRKDCGLSRSTFADAGLRSLGARTLKQRARNNLRAACHRQLRQSQADSDRWNEPASGEPTRAAKGTREDASWQRYRRENQGWRPPPEAAEPRPRGRGADRLRSRKRKKAAQTAEKAAETAARTARPTLKNYGAALPGATPKPTKPARKRNRHGRGAATEQAAAEAAWTPARPSPTTARPAPSTARTAPTTTTTSTGAPPTRPRPSTAPAGTLPTRPRPSSAPAWTTTGRRTAAPAPTTDAGGRRKRWTEF